MRSRCHFAVSPEHPFGGVEESTSRSAVPSPPKVFVSFPYRVVGESERAGIEFSFMAQSVQAALILAKALRELHPGVHPWVDGRFFRKKSKQSMVRLLLYRRGSLYGRLYTSARYSARTLARWWEEKSPRNRARIFWDGGKDVGSWREEVPVGG